MAEPEARWIQAHAAKMDPRLQRELINVYQTNWAMPGWVNRMVLSWRKRRRHVPILFQLHRECPWEEGRAFAQALGRFGCENACLLELVGSVAATVPIGSLPQLLGDERIGRAVYDREMYALMDVAAPTVRAPAAWQSGLTGKGVTVAVIDTGIHPHKDFTEPVNRIVAFRDFVGGRRAPYDDNGHGTHVAGIVGGNGYGSRGRYKGIAPEVNLVGVKVLDASGMGKLSTVIRGIQWCVEQKDALGIRVINLSLGGPAVESYRDDPVARAVERAWESGLVVCAAAGNEGPKPKTIGSPGIHPRIITVGAADDRNTPSRRGDRVASFSSRGPTIDGLPKPDLLAPGVNITAPSRSRFRLPFRNRPEFADYVTMSGTSAATPVCSGIVALMLQQDGSLTPDAVKERLLRTATTLGYDANTEGKGLVDAAGAMGAGRSARRVTW